MATMNNHEFPRAPLLRCESPSEDTNATPAMGHYPPLSRCSSTISQASQASGPFTSRDSLGSDTYSRQSSGSYQSRRSDESILSRQSTNSSHESTKSRRRGYMRPRGTYFAASARSRESVMSLGSIAHLQYYFARTGLLDGKGGRLARKKPNGDATPLDLAALEASTPAVGDGLESIADGDSPGTLTGVETEPAGEEGEEEFEESFTESESGMLDPTVSTYVKKEITVPKPPTILELKAEVKSTLTVATEALREVRERKAGTFVPPPDAVEYPNMPEEDTQGWYQLQGMHILDVVTLAIRAAKMYYTAHELPDRLDSIKSEREVRTDLLAVMETLKQMGVRNFKGGMRDEEIVRIENWIESIWGILRKDAELDAAEKAERDGWKWMQGDWTGRELQRERAFLMAMDTEAEELPEWTPAAGSSSSSTPSTLPTPFLQAMRDGVRLVKLHNAVVKRSKRRFGAIPSFHTDTQKPYRCADNLRYWVKAAELRFEVLLKMDPLAIQYGQCSPEVWIQFDEAMAKWCREVREEFTRELNAS